MNWNDYEKEIHHYFVRTYPNADISYNVTVKGRYSQTERQIDILIEDYVAGSRIRIVVDGKFFSQKIDVKNVEAFIGMLNDCEVNKGLLITQEGYTEAAVKRAHHDPLDIDLDILNFRELSQFQNYGGIPFSGSYGIIAPAPFGWIIDATSREGMLASFYQRGLTFEEALKSKEWIYVNIMQKDNVIKSLDDLLKRQKEYTVIDFPKAKIGFLPTIKREGVKTKLRTIEISSYPTIEYTGFVEFDEFIFFAVLFTPLELKKKNIRKLEEIMLNVFPLNVIQPKIQ
jgi:hypothetical protein